MKNGNGHVEKLKILVIDDDEDDLFITSEFLKGISYYDVSIDTELNFKKAEETILSNSHDIYLVDYLLGPFTGIDLIQNSIKAGNRKPFILLTGKGYRTIDMQAAGAGAYDYLIKGEINSELLERSIRYSMERYKAYISLAQSEKRYREIFDKSKDIIFLSDDKGRFIDFNEAMVTVLGYTRHELLNTGMADLYYDTKQRESIIANLERYGEISDTEVELRTKDGEKKYFIASGIRIVNSDGEVMHQGLLHDYTLRKGLEKENILNEKVAAISRLVRSLAHEIRNPLTNINLAMEQLGTELQDDQKVFSDIVLRNSNRINHIISELTNLSRSDELSQSEMDIRTVMDVTLDKALDRFELKSIALNKKYPEEALMVHVDLNKMQMALINFIINAIEASEKMTGKVDIEIFRSGGLVVIKISDNGCGIAADAIPYLFEPYFTRKKNGMGLGLATSHNIIKLHKGTIEVTSEMGKGSEFVIKLPLKAA